MGETTDLDYNDIADLIRSLPVVRLNICALFAHSYWVRRTGTESRQETDGAREGRLAVGVGCQG